MDNKNQQNNNKGTFVREGVEYAPITNCERPIRPGYEDSKSDK